MQNALRLAAASGICAAILVACGGVNTQTGATSSPTPTATPTATETGTPIETPTPDESPSPTASATSTATPTATPTGTMTATPTPTPMAVSGLHLAEVFYDPSGTDDGLEWVLLANDTDSS